MSIHYHPKSKRAYDSKTGRFVSFKKARKSNIFRTSYIFFTTKKRKPRKRKIIPPLEWDELTDIMEAYADAYNFGEDEREYVLGLINKIGILQCYRYREPKTLWCATNKKIPLRKIVKKITVWYLMYRESSDTYTVSLMNHYNDNKLNVNQLIKYIHSTLKEGVNIQFRKEEELEGTTQKMEHIIAIHE